MAELTDLQAQTSRKRRLEPEKTAPDVGLLETLKESPKKMACNQTAVAVLQELCMKRKWNPPIYDVCDCTGPSNDPMFEVQVSLCNGIQGVGRGRQKKAAKHDAAKKVLAILHDRALLNSSESTPVSAPKTPINPHEDVGGINPVGDLQNLCSQKHFPPPVYTVIVDAGEPHEKVFTYECKVSERSATGTARKKQLAKHLAAFNLLQILNSNLKTILNEIPNDPAVSSNPKESSQEEAKKDVEVVKKYKILSDLRDDVPSSPMISPGTRFIDYHTSYAAQLKGLKALLETPVIKHSKTKMEKLELIAKDLNLLISITEDQGKDGEFIVFIHMNTDPPTIQAGKSKCIDMATEVAASNVLDFLCLMSS